MEQFQIDHDLPFSDINQEDDELFSLGQIDPDLFDMDTLVLKGLHYDNVNQRSDDFVILDRYGDFFWDVNWVKHNRVFAWHVDTRKEILMKVDEISSMTLDGIVEQMDKGNNLFKTIRTDNT